MTLWEMLVRVFVMQMVKKKRGVGVVFVFMISLYIIPIGLGHLVCKLSVNLFDRCEDELTPFVRLESVGLGDVGFADDGWDADDEDG